jgi:pyruvate dehydrogenase E2 component (dihydrolipoyllysine-residue acetyltransferase)
MATEIPMPRLSDTMERGTVARWAKKEGDTVAEGEVLADIETDKATMELESYENGVLLKILVQEGESAELGAPIALVGEAGETVELPPANGDAPAPSEQAPAEAPKAEPAAGRAARPAQPANGGASGSVELRASPIARRMAADAGLDLRPLAGRGSGPDGRIVKVDVERLATEGVSARAAAAPPTTPRTPPPPAPVPAAWEGAEGKEPSAMQRAVARRMTES